MFSYARRLLGSVYIKEIGDIIKIDGLPADLIAKDIYRHWSTSRITEYMFNRITSSSVSFHKFFAPDFVYTLEEMCRSTTARYHTRALKHVVEKMYEHTWMKNTLVDYPDILDFSKLKNINVPLFPHQLDFLEFYNKAVPRFNLKGMCLGASAGSGKTLINIALAECLDADVCICIVPKNSVERVWNNTLRTFMSYKVKFWSTLHNTPIDPKAKYYVFHYEQLEKAMEFFKNKKYKTPVIVLDESHNFNEMVSLRTQNFIAFCKQMNCRNVIWSSGTLVKAIGGEVIPILHTLDDYFTPTVEERFRKIFGKNSSRAADILANRLGKMMFKVVKSDVIKNEVTTNTKLIKLPNGNEYTLESIRKVMTAFIEQRSNFYKSNMSKYQKTYSECLTIHEHTLKTSAEKLAFSTYKDYVAMIRRGYDPEIMKGEVMYCNKYELKTIIPTLPNNLKIEFKDIRSIIKYVNLKIQGEALGRILGKLRTKCNLDIIYNSHIEDEIDDAVAKTVIFTSYVDVVDELYDYLIELGYTPLKIYGDTNKDLVKIIDKFDKDIDANPLIATLQSLSTAVPLTMASSVVFMNAPFRDYEYQQAVARVDRLGQNNPVTITNVLLDTGAEDNISTRAADIMTWSREQANAILGIKDDSSGNVSLEEFTDFIDGSKYMQCELIRDKPSWLNW